MTSDLPRSASPDDLIIVPEDADETDAAVTGSIRDTVVFCAITPGRGGWPSGGRMSDIPQRLHNCSGAGQQEEN